MDPGIVVAIMIGLMLILIIFEMPIAFAIAIAGSLGLVIIANWGTLLYALGSYPVSTISTYGFSAIPLYVLLGNLAAASGAGADAYEVAYKWTAKLKGGLVIASVAASGFIGATTGSSATAIPIMGKIAVPEMVKLGYDRSLATGGVASSGPLGSLIPPSTTFIIIGLLTEISIGKLFIAGIVPGIVSIALFSIMVFIRCAINPKLAPQGVSFSWKDRFLSLRKAWGITLIFIVIVGGLYSGIATAIEVGALGCLVALVMAITSIPSKKCSWKKIWGAGIDGASIAAMLFAFIIGAGIFSLFVTRSGIIHEAVEFVMGIGLSTTVILMIVVVIYFVLGMFFSATAMLMVSVPILFPIVVDGLGVDPVWFSVITAIMVEIGALSPPIGMALFLMHGVYPQASLVEISRGSIWFIAMNLLVVAILFIFPELATWLPNLMI